MLCPAMLQREGKRENARLSFEGQIPIFPTKFMRSHVERDASKNEAMPWPKQNALLALLVSGKCFEMEDAPEIHTASILQIDYGRS